MFMSNEGSIHCGEALGVWGQVSETGVSNLTGVVSIDSSPGVATSRCVVITLADFEASTAALSVHLLVISGFPVAVGTGINWR